jgi:hypothetical protein
MTSYSDYTDYTTSLFLHQVNSEMIHLSSCSNAYWIVHVPISTFLSMWGYTVKYPCFNQGLNL